MSIQPISPLNLDRYELKYIIPRALVAPISAYVEQYCEMDYYSKISPDNFYVINSLYLDTPSLFIARKQQNSENDYSCFRVRSYGADPKPPFYFESKQKIHSFCKKRRGKVPITNFGDIFQNPAAVEEQGFNPYADKNTASFIEKVHTFGLEPKILTQYRRKAYLSVHDDYARVTFDRDMKYMEETNWNAVPDESRMTNYDHPESFDLGADTGGCNVVMELKCERKIPLWFIQMIRGFELVQHGFSKFQYSMVEMQGYHNTVLNFDLQSKENSLFREGSRNFSLGSSIFRARN